MIRDLRETYEPIEDGPISIAEAVARYGPEAIPKHALDDATHYVATHVGPGNAYVLVALNARYFAEKTKWCLVRDRDTGKQRLMYRCPQDGELIEHPHEHWDDEGVHRTEKASRRRAGAWR